MSPGSDFKSTNPHLRYLHRRGRQSVSPTHINQIRQLHSSGKSKFASIFGKKFENPFDHSTYSLMATWSGYCASERTCSAYQGLCIVILLRKPSLIVVLVAFSPTGIKFAIAFYALLPS